MDCSSALLEYKYHQIEAEILNKYTMEVKTMALWEVAVVSKVSKNDADSGIEAKLLLAPVAVVAGDEKEAIVKATSGKNLTAPFEVLVRPFK